MAQRTATHAYDTAGSHAGVTEGGVTATSERCLVHDGWNVLAIFNPQSSILQSFVWGLDLSGTPQGAGGVGGLLASITGATAQFAAYDGNGNVRALADGGTGAWGAQYEYGPFGELIRATGPQAKANPFRFSTKWHDDESDLLYYGYRYYQPATGRWISRDPIGERGGLALLGFLRNATLSAIDALGLSDVEGDDVEQQIEALADRNNFTVKKICKTVTTTANTAFEFTPQNEFSQAVFGQSLSGEKVGIGQRVMSGAALGGGWIIGKLVKICCGKKTVCVFVKTIQDHHLIPQDGYRDHPLIRAAGIDIATDPANLMPLVNHAGRHTDEYHQTVNQLLDAANEDVLNGNLSPREAYEGVCRIIREGITDGWLKPYNSKEVYPVP